VVEVTFSNCWSEMPYYRAVRDIVLPGCPRCRTTGLSEMLYYRAVRDDSYFTVVFLI